MSYKKAKAKADKANDYLYKLTNYYAWREWFLDVKKECSGSAGSLEYFLEDDNIGGSVTTTFRDVYDGTSYAADTGGHGRDTASVFLGSFPECPFYSFPYENLIKSKTVGGVTTYSGVILDVADFVADSNIDVIFHSATDKRKGLSDVFKDSHSKCIAFVSSGNDSDEDVNKKIDEVFFLGVGAGDIDEDDLSISVADYSNSDNALDCLGPGLTYIVSQNGVAYGMSMTSNAAPYVAMQAKYVNEWFWWKINRPLSCEEMSLFVSKNCADVGSAGWDEESGYGLFEPETPEELALHFEDYLIDSYTLVDEETEEEEDEVQTTTITAEMNGVSTTLTSILYNNENYIRIRDLANAQSDDKLTVDWDAGTKTVIITSK